MPPERCSRDALIARGRRIFAAHRAQRTQQIQMAARIIAAGEDLGLRSLEEAVRKAAEEIAAELRLAAAAKIQALSTPSRPPPSPLVQLAHTCEPVHGLDESGAPG